MAYRDLVSVANLPVSNHSRLFVQRLTAVHFDQAELVSVEGKEIEGHYVLAKEFIQKWNSTSDCYLLVEGVERTLTVIINSVQTLIMFAR